MHKKFLAVAGLLFLSLAAYAAVPTVVSKNNFGEQTTNFILGGSNQLDINFVVDPNNANGLGISSLSGAAAQAVYMHTNVTPAAGNPNPAPGYVLVQFKKAYSGYIGGYAGYVAPNSGSDIVVSTTGTTAGLAYVITSVGSTPASQWQLLGFPTSETPAVGAAFIASATTTATGTGVVQVPVASGSNMTHLELVGNGSQTVNAVGGGQLVMVNLSATNATTTTLAPAAPTAGSIIRLRFVMGTIPAGF